MSSIQNVKNVYFNHHATLIIPLQLQSAGELPNNPTWVRNRLGRSQQSNYSSNRLGRSQQSNYSSNWLGRSQQSNYSRNRLGRSQQSNYSSNWLGRSQQSNYTPTTVAIGRRSKQSGYSLNFPHNTKVNLYYHFSHLHGYFTCKLPVSKFSIFIKELYVFLYIPIQNYR